MRYRIAYINNDGKLQSREFATEQEMDNFILGILDSAKRIRCRDKETNKVWNI
jgi:hypothetical protein